MQFSLERLITKNTCDPKTLESSKIDFSRIRDMITCLESCKELCHDELDKHLIIFLDSKVEEIHHKYKLF